MNQLNSTPGNSRPQFSSLRQIVTPKDLMLYTGYCAEACRRILRRVREQLGKKVRDHVSVSELCEVTKYNEDSFRNIMRTPLLYFAFVFGMLYLFRNDMDIYGLWLAVLMVGQLEFEVVRRGMEGLRRLLMIESSND